MDELIKRATAWAEGDCDDGARAQALAMVQRGDGKELKEHFGGNLAFGTAGLRAVVGVGPSCINLAVIRRVSWAVAQYLKKQTPDWKSRPVVVGRDARLSSAEFAAATIGVLTAQGIPVRYFADPVPTPLVAYAARQYRAIAAIVVTASHNPPEYNGYKLYAENGVQIVSPADEQIAALIAEAPAAKNIKCEALGAKRANTQLQLSQAVDTPLVDGYFRAINGLRPTVVVARDLSIVYTPMHGVGGPSVKRALRTAGFSRVAVVAEQAEPDGNFPTVRFPNPEEPGAMDLAYALAEREAAELVIANDPDADRLAAAVRDSSGELKPLTGNQLGILLADYQLSRYRNLEPGLVVCSIVSTPMLQSVAKAYGARCEQTLTGFKWLWNAALDLKRSGGFHFVFGFEEALGYSAEDIVRDKDGVSAALLMAELAAARKASGSSVLARLEELYREHGLWVSVQHSVRREGTSGAGEIAAAVESLGQNTPKEIGGVRVAGLRDFRTGAESRPRWLENSPLLEFSLGERGRVLVRPSGTEPKLKFYVDLRTEVAADADVWRLESETVELAQACAKSLSARAGLE